MITEPQKTTGLAKRMDNPIQTRLTVSQKEGDSLERFEVDFYTWSVLNLPMGRNTITKYL